MHIKKWTVKKKTDEINALCKQMNRLTVLRLRRCVYIGIIFNHIYLLIHIMILLNIIVMFNGREWFFSSLRSLW